MTRSSVPFSRTAASARHRRWFIPPWLSHSARLGGIVGSCGVALYLSGSLLRDSSPVQRLHKLITDRVESAAESLVQDQAVIDAVNQAQFACVEGHPAVTLRLPTRLAREGEDATVCTVGLFPASTDTATLVEWLEANGVENPDSAEATKKLVVIGNPGTGKSYLINQWLRICAFESGRAVFGLTQTCQRAAIIHADPSTGQKRALILYNLPGVHECDRENRERNIGAIDTALRRELPNAAASLMYVLGSERQTYRADADLIAAVKMSLVADPDDEGAHWTFVLNKIDPASFRTDSELKHHVEVLARVANSFGGDNSASFPAQMGRTGGIADIHLSPQAGQAFHDAVVHAMALSRPLRVRDEGVILGERRALNLSDAMQRACRECVAELVAGEKRMNSLVDRASAVTAAFGSISSSSEQLVEDNAEFHETARNSVNAAADFAVANQTAVHEISQEMTLEAEYHKNCCSNIEGSLSNISERIDDLPSTGIRILGVVTAVIGVAVCYLPVPGAQYVGPSLAATGSKLARTGKWGFSASVIDTDRQSEFDRRQRARSDALFEAADRVRNPKLPGGSGSGSGSGSGAGGGGGAGDSGSMPASKAIAKKRGGDAKPNECPAPVFTFASKDAASSKSRDANQHRTFVEYNGERVELSDELNRAIFNPDASGELNTKREALVAAIQERVAVASAFRGLRAEVNDSAAIADRQRDFVIAGMLFSRVMGSTKSFLKSGDERFAGHYLDYAGSTMLSGDPTTTTMPAWYAAEVIVSRNPAIAAVFGAYHDACRLHKLGQIDTAMRARDEQAMHRAAFLSGLSGEAREELAQTFLLRQRLQEFGHPGREATWRRRFDSYVDRIVAGATSDLEALRDALVSNSRRERAHDSLTAASRDQPQTSP